MVVQHNMQAMNANRMLNITTTQQSKSTEKLSSGYRINRAADDAAGLSISEKMRKQIKGLDQASTNAQDGVSAVQTAEGALTEVHSMLQRMNELAVQAANGTNSDSDRQSIQDEIDQLTTEIDRVAETTKFNETYLLKGNGKDAKHYMVGHDAGLEGTLTDGAETATFTMDALEIGDKINIGGKEYSIGGSATEAGALIEKAVAYATDNSTTATFTIGDDTYTAADDGTISGGKTVDELKQILQGTTVKYGDEEVTAMVDKDNDGVDDTDSSAISLDKAKTLIKGELTAANSIGVVNEEGVEATVDDVVEGTDTAGNATWTYTINKGYADVTDKLSFALHVGADADMTNKINVDIETMSSANLGIKGLNVKDDSGIAATYAIDAIADAVAKVSAQRSALGAVQNRLEHTIDNVDNVVENTTSAESRIRDTDMAEEMVEYSKNNILQQAGQSMLAQANQANQGVLSLLG